MVIALQTVVAVIGASWPKRRAGLGNALFSLQGPAQPVFAFFGQKRRLVLAFAPVAQKASIAVAAPHRRIIAGAPLPGARLRCKERAALRNAKKKGPCHLARALKNGQRESRHLPIFPSRLQPSIFGTTELNFCVRNGNRWDLRVIGTGRYAQSISAFASLF